MTILAKIDKNATVRVSTDGYTDTDRMRQTDTLTDANRFHSLSRAMLKLWDRQETFTVIMDYRCCDLLLSLLRITLCQNFVRHLEVLEDLSDDCRVSCGQSSSETVSALRRAN